MIRSSGLRFLALPTLLVAVAAACAPHTSPAPAAPSNPSLLVALSPSHLDRIRNDFNADSNHPRILVLLSPT